MSHVWTRIRNAVILTCAVLAMTTTTVHAALVLELTTPKARYLVGEPLFVVLTLRNTGVDDAMFVRSFALWTTRLTFDITPPGGERYRYESPLAATGGRNDTRGTYLGAGETYSASFELTWQKGKQSVACLLSQPGYYTIQAAYTLPGEPKVVLQSNEHQLLVKEPQGTDREVYNLLREIPRLDEENLWLAGKGADGLAIECYNRIVREYPDSGYTPHVAFFLASIYDARHKMKKAEKGVDEIGRAAQLFTLAAEKLYDSPLRSMALELTGRCLAEVGNLTQAWGMFEAALTSPAATDEDRLRMLLSMEHLPSEFNHDGSDPGSAMSAEPGLRLRPVAEALGFRVGWDNRTKTIAVDGTRLHGTLQVGKAAATLNGVAHTDIAPSLRNGEVLVSPSLVRALLVAQRSKGKNSVLESSPADRRTDVKEESQR